jgi:hypothetical protein
MPLGTADHQMAGATASAVRSGEQQDKMCSMKHLLTVTVSNPIAAGFGLAAMVCLAAWPLFCARAAMLMTYTGNNVGFLAHYACSASGPLPPLTA